MAISFSEVSRLKDTYGKLAASETGKWWLPQTGLAIRRLAGPLRRHVFCVLANAELADEVVQDIWPGVLQGIGR